MKTKNYKKITIYSVLIGALVYSLVYVAIANGRVYEAAERFLASQQVENRIGVTESAFLKPYPLKVSFSGNRGSASLQLIVETSFGIKHSVAINLAKVSGEWVVVSAAIDGSAMEVETKIRDGGD